MSMARLKNTMSDFDDRPDKAKVVLIRPPMLLPKDSVASNQGIPPIGLAYIAAAIKGAGFYAQAIDAVGEALEHTWSFRNLGIGRGLDKYQVLSRLDCQTAHVCVSCAFSNEWPFVRELIEAVAEKIPQARIILGGEHATADFEYILQNYPQVTACVLGEGDVTIVELLKALEKGEQVSNVDGIACRSAEGHVTRTAARQRKKQLDDLAWPLWDIFPLENYLQAGLVFGRFGVRSIPMIGSRGCPFECTFCSNYGMWGKR